MKRATSTPAGLNVKKITAYLKGQAKSRNAVRITCQSGSSSRAAMFRSRSMVVSPMPLGGLLIILRSRRSSAVLLSTQR